MKIERFNESQKFVPSNDEEMISYIADIISDDVDIRPVRYTEDDYEISPESVFKAANQIIQELKNIGVNFDLIYNIKKYNI
jgi:hypothetical protein